MAERTEAEWEDPAHSNKSTERQQLQKEDTRKYEKSGLQENATQRDMVGEQKPGAMARLARGMKDIVRRIELTDGFGDFIDQLDEMVREREKPQILIKVKQQQNQQKQGHSPLQNNSVVHEIEPLNQTPFFGNQKESMEAQQKKQDVNSVLSKIFRNIEAKSNEATQQLSINLNQYLHSKSSSDILQEMGQRMAGKMGQGLDQLMVFFKNQPQVKEQERQPQARTKHINNEVKNLEQDNEFMTEEFGSHQKLEQAQKFVQQMKNEAIQKYIKENEIAEQKRQKAILKLHEVMEKYQIRCSFMKIKQERNTVTPSKNQPEAERTGSALLSQRISSAQSQRLKSPASKNSQNQESFNLDLTVKTRNSKNPYQIGKMDSLMYSAQSGFNFQPESPNRNRRGEDHSNSSKSVKQKMDDIYEQQNEGRKSNLQKSHSQKVDHQKIQKPIKRITSSKQKIDQNEFESDKQKKEQNEPQLAQIIDQNHQFPKPKYRQYSQNQQQEQDGQIQGKKVSQSSKPYHQKKQIEAKNHRASKFSQKHKDDDDKSNKAETIINRVQNFDADDEDQQERELHQSANFAKNKKTEQLVRKRVQTQIAIPKKELKNQNYSIKNIKRFNKVDFSKHEELSNRSGSRVASQQNSNSNIFTTEIQGYQKKIAKLKQEKQLKKKNLQKELARINHEIKVLNQKEEELSPQNKNNFASRVKIADNNQAQRKAQSLVKNLRSQKRNRNIAKLGQFSNLDKNINDYMEELNKLRSQNEQKLKNKKKLQILQRMKQNQMRKLSQKKKISQNQNFVLHLKGVSGPLNNNLQLSNHKNQVEHDNMTKRNPTKQEQEIVSPVQSNMTPELNQKKAYLNKIRSFSVKKSTKDAYEQVLG